MVKGKRGVPVSTRALVQRINRKLMHEAEKEGVKGMYLHATRGAQAKQELGAYFVADSSGRLRAADFDLEEYGRKLGVLRPWESYAPDPEGR